MMMMMLMEMEREEALKFEWVERKLFSIHSPCLNRETLNADDSRSENWDGVKIAAHKLVFSFFEQSAESIIVIIPPLLLLQRLAKAFLLPPLFLKLWY